MAEQVSARNSTSPCGAREAFFAKGETWRDAPFFRTASVLSIEKFDRGDVPVAEEVLLRLD